MITKFSSIQNLAVFKNFVWDNTVVADGAARELKDINIIYGRNYSGKTTLSRIVRAIETGRLSDKYENPAFSVSVKDGTNITQNDLSSHSKIIRVFNEDFVRDNLRFIVNPDEDVQSFAILGNDNATIEAEISALQATLGHNESGNETGLYLSHKASKALYAQKQSYYNSAKKVLDDQLNSKATDKDSGIKYQFGRFGDQNYTRPKLDKEIADVQKPSYKVASDSEYEEMELLIKEQLKDKIIQTDNLNVSVSSINETANEILSRTVSLSGKIQQLIEDAVVATWVNQGRAIHKSKLHRCAFCDNALTDQRWKELESHFDEEMERLLLNLDKLISSINHAKAALREYKLIDFSKFYSKFQSKSQKISVLFELTVDQQINSLDDLVLALEARKSDPTHALPNTPAKDLIPRLTRILEIQEGLRVSSNNYSTSLKTDQENAKDNLRLKEVYDFIGAIKFTTATSTIISLKKAADDEMTAINKIQNDIGATLELIADKKRQLNDEEKGALKVNTYLNDFFGHNFLSLRAVDKIGIQGQPKSVRFEIIRDGKKAHHLSEGECSLIAFCYFMAKLEDVETKNSKPIVWIDDPISSLDGNHIFFIYSLINTEIVAKSVAEQLFISTHNLDFLKYLKRLPGAEITNENKTKYRFLVIQRHNNTSSITLMPKFLRDYVTEFNFLFAQIHKCASITIVDDENHNVFYNFGNNARKFLEVFLYYKYPDGGSQTDKIKKFFGGDALPAILTDRINNEYSHLHGVLERGELPIEVPEMNSTARLILERIRLFDNDQYESLLRSIGALPPPNAIT